MSRFAGQTSTRPWVGMAGSGATASEPAAADVARDNAAAAMRGAGAGAATATNASAISFGFAATAVLVSMFLLMAIFEHLIKPGLASSSSSSSRGASGSHEDDAAAADDGEGRGHRHRTGGSPPARLRERDDAAPDKLISHLLPKVEAVVDLTVLMPGQRYPTFLAQPAPLAPCPREGVLWPSHDRRRSFVPP
uniref:Uncharacterized protein n=1 Tax=Zea mays TaxID=4577 RepID=B6SN80_MAIZE|nr:hypothetical protein [Zea mays]